MTMCGRPSSPIVVKSISVSTSIGRRSRPLRARGSSRAAASSAAASSAEASVAGRVVVELPQRVVERAADADAARALLDPRVEERAEARLAERPLRQRSCDPRDRAGVVGDELLVARCRDPRRRAAAPDAVRGRRARRGAARRRGSGSGSAARRSAASTAAAARSTAARRAPSGSIGHCSTRRSPRYGSSPGSSSGSLDAERVGDLDEERAALARPACVPDQLDPVSSRWSRARVTAT